VQGNHRRSNSARAHPSHSFLSLSNRRLAIKLPNWGYSHYWEVRQWPREQVIMKKESSESLRDRLMVIVAFLPGLREQGSSSDGRIDRPAARGLVRAAPVFSLSDIQQSFVRTAADHGWMLPELNWPQWAQTSEAEALRDRPEALTEATPRATCSTAYRLDSSRQVCGGYPRLRVQ
jgi:hypothetical protein